MKGNFPLMVKCTLINPTKNLPRERTLILFDHFLCKMKKSKDGLKLKKYIETDFSLFHYLGKDSDTGETMFSLTRNGARVILRFREEALAQSMMEALRKCCILTDFKKDYDVIKAIGKGAHAKVFLAISKRDQKEYAIKSFQLEDLRKESDSQPGLINEVNIMRKVSNHPGTIKLYEIYETRNHINLVMEVLKGGTLLSRLEKVRKMPIEEAAFYIHQLISAVAHVHSHNIMHRDIKLLNILFLDEVKPLRLKLVDFGLATDVDAVPYLYSKCGTPGYVAPEIFKVKPNDKYDAICDVFSLGVIFYIMITGKLLFEGVSYNEVLSKNKKAIIDVERVRKEVNNEEAAMLILQMVEPDPTKRISIDALAKNIFLEQFSNGGSPGPRRGSLSVTTAADSKPMLDFSIGSQVAKDNSSFICGKKPAINGTTSQVENTVYDSPQTVGPESIHARMGNQGGQSNSMIPSPFRQAHERKVAPTTPGSSPINGPSGQKKGGKAGGTDMIKRAIFTSYLKKTAMNPGTEPNSGVIASTSRDPQEDCDVELISDEENNTPASKILKIKNFSTSTKASMEGRRSLSTSKLTGNEEIKIRHTVEVEVESEGGVGTPKADKGPRTDFNVKAVKKNLKNLV
eukprot:TRINITY_DN15838_c0_g1_i1.p1 TRINITY_DN15838_c0_g1~~TRINITY_DN15838_c0_g1_i1.p1  ORF type:complete len:628 (-),score=122.88 TRINITY_DN15838_c0_g1_i1:27-1910(-)